MKTRCLMTKLALGAACGLVLSGCVMAEKYEAEKARGLNFQRLLAQEEKRTGELDSELKRTKSAVTETEARNRELGAQLQAVREQFVKIQEDTAATMKAVQQQQEEMGKGPKAAARPKKPSQPVVTASAADPLTSNDALLGSGESGSHGGSAVYHLVKPGETLFKISKRYKVEVRSLRNWNRLESDQLEVGQRLVVGYE
ncbi:MAG: LysM peptidoglycan-binding domain-containing protein [Nitrospira sp.]|nr:MAG: LysM peptidoglycan-binding domain-containing protein [Nitrospira sp.]